MKGNLGSGEKFYPPPPDILFAQIALYPTTPKKCYSHGPSPNFGLFIRSKWILI